MKTDQPSVATGDWVYSDSPGIWRVARIVQNVQRLRFSLQDRKRVNRERIIFCKRIVDESWRPAFSTEVASDPFVQLLSGDDRRRLDEYVAANPHVLNAFEAFEPTMIDHAMDLRLDVPAATGKDGIQRLVNDAFAGIETGLTNDEVLQRLDSSPLAPYVTVMSGNAMLRFLSKGHDIRNTEYLFREVQLLMV